jgi:glycosyltransferase involved in cell wall biosynthesis
MALAEERRPRHGLARRLWRRLPHGTRQRILFDASRVLAPRPGRAPRGGMPIAIAGLFSTASGVGEGARLAYAALDASGIAPQAFDLSPAFGQVELPSHPALRALAPGEGSLIVHINAPYVPHALWALGRARIAGRRIIGYWAWELPRLPATWRLAVPFVHEVWVPSTFTAEAVRAAIDRPVRVVPHPLPTTAPTPGMRARLGLPADALVVLNVFHLGSAFTRKNPIAAVHAFRQAFGDAPNRVLAIKLIDNGAVPWALQSLNEAIGGATNIRLIEGMLPAPDMAGLVAASDIVVSLHRSEGFGLVPAEGMRFGKPVIATNWSGNLEFMTERNSALVRCSLVPVDDPEGAIDGAGQVWADADVDDAAQWLRRLADDAGLRGCLGAAAAADVGSQLSPQKFVRTVAELVQAQEQTNVSAG